MANELRKRAKTRITDANPRFLTIIGLLDPSAAAAGKTVTRAIIAFTGGIWPDGDLILNTSTLRFEGNWSTELLVGHSVGFTINLSTIIQIQAGRRILKSRIVTLRISDGEVLVNPVWGGIDTDIFLDALRQAVVKAGGRT